MIYVLLYSVSCGDNTYNVLKDGVYQLEAGIPLSE